MVWVGEEVGGGGDGEDPGRRQQGGGGGKRANGGRVKTRRVEAGRLEDLKKQTQRLHDDCL